MGDAIKPVNHDKYSVLKCFPHNILLLLVLKARDHIRLDAKGGIVISFSSSSIPL
jgi:hypothetical protein